MPDIREKLKKYTDELHNEIKRLENEFDEEADLVKDDKILKDALYNSDYYTINEAKIKTICCVINDLQDILNEVE